MQRIRTRHDGRGLLFGLAFAASSLAVLPAIAGAQGKVYSAAELTTKPKVESMSRTAQLVQHSYPDKLKAAGVNGTVQVQFVIGADGKVEASSIEIVVATVPALGDAARQVAAKLEFEPGKVNDSPVRTRVLLPIVYKVR